MCIDLFSVSKTSVGRRLDVCPPFIKRLRFHLDYIFESMGILSGMARINCTFCQTWIYPLTGPDHIRFLHFLLALYISGFKHFKV